jgi:dienelactone hydrolase
MIAVLTAYEQIRRTFAADGLRFAGHVSCYGCSVARLEAPQTTGAPVLMMLGELDRNVSIPRSRDIADDLARGGSDVDFKVFDNTYHQWDGADVERRFVRFSLVGCRSIIEPDNEIRDLRTGLRIRGRISRTLVIANALDWSGYHIQRNEAVLRRSHEALLAFLAGVSCDP